MTKFSDDVSDEDRNRITGLCEQYLGGDWVKNHFIIKRFAVGFFNKIFYCQLNDEINSNGQQYKEVVVKLALEEEYFLYNPLNSLINTLIISEAEITPKVLAVFPGGLISEYIESRPYNHLDYDNPKLVSLLGRKLAKFHSLKSPIIRDGTKRWFDQVFGEFLGESTERSLGDVHHIYDIIQESDCDSLKRVDFKGQLIWLREALYASDKILVFSHCDLNRGNILVKQFNDCLDLFFIDFDFTAYNYRGIDFGRYWSSWRQTEPNFGSGDYPTDQQMRPLIDAYIEESNRLTNNEFSKSVLNSRKHLINECKLFTLVGVLIDVLFCLFKTAMDPNISEEFLKNAERRYGFYLKLKEKFQKEKALPKGFN